MDKTPPQRGHALLTDKSPLTSALCKAAGLPDVEALMVALAHPMTEGDEEALVRRAGGHPAHKTRLKHLRKLAQERGEEETQKSLRLTKGMLPRYYGTKNPETGKKHQGKVNYGEVKHPGSRGGHWFINGAGHIEYGERPAPFRAIADFDHDDGHEHAAYEQLLREAGGDEHVGNHLLFTSNEDRSRLAALAAADLGDHRTAPEVKRILDYHHADTLRQFRAHPMHKGVGDSTRREHQPVDPADLKRALDAWQSCDEEERKGGEVWYETARALAKKWSKESGYSYLRCAAVIALTSQENAWDLNLKQAEYALFGRLSQGDNTRTWEHKYSSVRDKVHAVLHNRYPTRYVTGDKIRSFLMNILGVGNGRVVTIDRHMYNIMGADKSHQKSSDYNYYRRVFIAAAHHVGVPPDVFQAATWAWYANGPAKEKARANGQPDHLIGRGNSDTTLAGLRRRVTTAAAAKSFREHLATRNDSVYSGDKEGITSEHNPRD